MFGIGEFFKKIQGSFTKELLIRGAVAEAISKHVGIDVPVTDIEIRSFTIRLKGVSQVARSAIFIKKSAILADIAMKQDILKLTDIK